MQAAGMRFRLSFWWGAAFELALLLVAVGLARIMGVSWLSTGQWRLEDCLLGAAGGIPLLVLFTWLMHTEVKPLRQIRVFLDEVVRPAMVDWSVVQLLAISLLVGVAEEALFRSVVQGGLEGSVGALPALVLASALFGACHWISAAYAVVAGLMGVYLGVLWWWTGNLLTPIVTHALYDFVALVWLLRLRGSGS